MCSDRNIIQNMGEKVNNLSSGEHEDIAVDSASKGGHGWISISRTVRDITSGAMWQSMSLKESVYDFNTTT